MSYAKGRPASLEIPVTWAILLVLPHPRLTFPSLPGDLTERRELVALHTGSRRKEEGKKWFSTFRMTECQQ